MQTCPTCGAPKPNEDWDWSKAVIDTATERRDGELILKDGEVVFGRLNGDWKVGADDAGRAIVYTGIIGVDGWQLVCRPNPLRDESATEVAHMIAAAPDLYMALKGAVRLAKERHLAGNEMTPGEREWFVDAVKAIEKADRLAIQDQIRKASANQEETVPKEEGNEHLRSEAQG